MVAWRRPGRQSHKMNLQPPIRRYEPSVMKTYGQYCPIARASELLAERWTPILVRNLLAGCRTFTELRDGAPGIPKALLVERLALLERSGVVTREPHSRGRGWTYELTEAGRELNAVCDALGTWGAR